MTRTRPRPPPPIARPPPRPPRREPPRTSVTWDGSSWALGSNVIGILGARLGSLVCTRLRALPGAIGGVSASQTRYAATWRAGNAGPASHGVESGFIATFDRTPDG